MEIAELTPLDVAARLDADEHAVYLDVRSEHEFEQGHPAGALNVPILHFDFATGQPQPNHQFLAVVRATIAPDVAIFVGCASGQRSYQAAGLMKAAGYRNVFNVDGGYSGKRDVFGRTLQPGWAECGLPCTNGDGDERSYSNLLELAADRQQESEE